MRLKYMYVKWVDKISISSEFKIMLTKFSFISIPVFLVYPTITNVKLYSFGQATKHILYYNLSP